MTTHQQLIDAMKETTRLKYFQGNKWGLRHVRAWNSPAKRERGIVALIRALATYADEFFREYETRIGTDGYAGDIFANMLRSTHHLLNHDIGRLDGGTLDALLHDMAKLEELEEEFQTKKENHAQE